MALIRHTTGFRGRARRTSLPDAQRGAALLTAMIIVTLVSTLASAMVWQQWRAVQVESAERDRTQATWTLSSALQFASLVLNESAKKQPNTYTALTDFWATPLAEGRVSTLNGTDKSTAEDDDSQGFLSGSIEDAQARYNLLNLLTPVPSGGPPGVKYMTDKDQLQIFNKLCGLANVDSSVASRISTQLLEAANGNSAAAPLMPETVDQLIWFGLDQASIDSLRPYIVLLPPPIGTPFKSTPVNANTASLTVLSAILDAGQAGQIMGRRQKQPFQSTGDVLSMLAVPNISPSLGVQSSYFEVRGRLRLADRVLSQLSLVYRDGTAPAVARRSERVSSLEQVAP